MQIKKLKHPLLTKIKKPIKNLRRTLYAGIHCIRHFLKSPLIDFKLNYHSENGEDGVIAEIFSRLGIHSGFVVEFGAWDGIYASNTFHLLRKGNFKAVYIEGDAKRFEDLQKTATRMKGKIIPIHAFVGTEGSSSLDALLSSTDIPKDFELLSIDIDGADYQVWEAFKNYRPKVVIIEVNASIPLDTLHIHGDGTYNGTSFASMLKLGNCKGYTCVLHTGNILFVRGDLASQVVNRNLSYDDQRSLFRLKK
jgi:hypothetical protein